MSNTTPSPNMNMPVPVVGTDPGSDWATNIDACLSIVDSHNHASGQGVQVTPSGLNINADLPFGGNNATTLRSTRFSSQGSPLAGGSDLDCLYVSGGDLYYNDGSGNQIRLTQAGTINLVTSGAYTPTITYTHVSGGTATFTSNSITAYYIRVANVVQVSIYQQFTTSAYSGSSGSYSVTATAPINTTTFLPTGSCFASLPSSQSLSSTPVVPYLTLSTVTINPSLTVTGNGAGTIVFQFMYQVN